MATLSDRTDYEKKLRQKQKEHLDSIQAQRNRKWSPCFHDACTQCYGTGIKIDGRPCVHGISCPCPKCTSTC